MTVTNQIKNHPPIVSEEEWQSSSEHLLAKEKEATKMLDALAAERRRMPMVEIQKEYAFEGPDGPSSLLDLFEDRSQLILYHFMLGPNQDFGVGPVTPQPEKYQDVEMFGFSVFLRDGSRIFRTYFTNLRGAEYVGSVWTLLDLTPLGRQENWEDSPEGWPQSEPYQWWRRHDEYEDAVSSPVHEQTLA